MARKPRIEIAGSLYHVITRGNQKQKVFKERDDNLKYIDILSRYKDKYRFSLYSYVLMTNHVHLLIETGSTPLSKILQGINQSYTIYFNKKYNTVGHLFQGRYKSILCDKDEYLLSLIKYIHLNPVRAKIADAPERYEWSSHHDYIWEGRKETLTDIGYILDIFAEHRTTARKCYIDYMRDTVTVSREDVYRTVDQRLLGREGFVERIKEISNEGISQTKREREFTLDEIASSVEKICGISIKDIRSKGKSREASLGRKLLSLASHEYGYKGKEIAEYSRKDPAVITRHLKEKEGLKRKVGRVIEALRLNVNKQV